MKKWLKGEESKTLYYSYVLLTMALFCDRIVNEYILESDIVYDPATATRGIHEKKEKLKPPSMSTRNHRLTAEVSRHYHIIVLKMPLFYMFISFIGARDSC
jgi:hypothetical protein